MTAEIKIKLEQDVWYLLGNKESPVIVQGKNRGMFINGDYGVTYVIMDTHVVYTKNKKYKLGVYLPSKNIRNEDIGKIAFLSKDEIKNKVREMRAK